MLEPISTDSVTIARGDARTIAAARAALEGRRRGVRALLPFLGPAFIASVAYVDPGNFATNLSGGASFGYLLLWAVLAANVMAMLVQMLAAKLGIATGRNLAELCRERFQRRASVALWLQAEVVAVATDLAEVIGAALGINLLFGIPLVYSGLLAGGASFALLALQHFGFRQLEAVITALVGTIVVGIGIELARATPDSGEVARHLLVPSFAGHESVLLAVGIVGATVMPHVIYLHSALTQDRVRAEDDGQRRRTERYERGDVLIAMAIAGFINLAMLAVFAELFQGTAVDTITGAFHALERGEGRLPALAFGIALLASGLSSASVGTYAGQVVMQGFIRRRIPLFARRAVTLVPSLVVIAIGVDPTRALVLSQVVLSFGIPFALVPLVAFTSRRELMGSLANTRLTATVAWAVAALIIALNLYLLSSLVPL